MSFIADFLAKHPTGAVKNAEGTPCVTSADVHAILQQILAGSGPALDVTAADTVTDAHFQVPPAGTKPARKMDTSTTDELDLLAVWFTLVKVLFIAGRVRGIVALANLLEKVRAGRDLHLTAVRNEHAYFCCVAQTAAHVDASRAEADIAAKRIVYMVGDSHSVPPGWQRVETVGKTIWPKLVTGIKAWYLRPGCDFYPRLHFDNTVASIPDGSDVVFVIGEIDCREGILLCVEKLKYDSVDEGIAVSVDHYVNQLTSLVKKRNFNVLVHPVVPVLDVTRHLVAKFNACLAARLARLPSSSRIRFLAAVQDKLLTPAGEFDLTYALDGTHMHPKYVHDVLAPAMAE